MRLVYTERAARDIRRFPSDVKQRLKTTLERYQSDPLPYARKLSNPELGDYRFRMGDYPIVFDIEDDAIVILRVGHRRDIYRG
uniref:mRNA interferase RelE/StbE n=1 Tax=Candidatus Kentrum eta TaxID=2126337 RepID=A0A450UBU9_9GAMM|nr:MAG: mRNA interferase RelE/StbE [Candidatus Kentron sp. H]VFJ91251.1 MAG: mRNA interferase RelE/StbE [Candidatus Kentron sp. H]VFJ97790.1 MAG: mRNA interferase RelE/StbE [Candidatus Kentron sp. H]